MENSSVVVDDSSKFRCDHWKNFARHMQEWLAGKQLPEMVLHFMTTDTEVPSDGKLHLIFGQSRWEISGAIEDREGSQSAQGLAVKMYLRISGLPDCPDDGNARESEAVKKLLDRLLPQMIEQDPEKRAAMIDAAKKAERVRSRKAYTHECSRRFEKTVQGTQEAVAKGHLDIARLQQELARRIRETHGAERKLEQIESLRGDQTASYGREFDSLIAVPGVENVEVADGVIKVFTEHIYIKPDGRETYDIGKFRMEIYTAGSNGGIRFFNLTRQGKGGDYNINHPHVKKNGSPCLGNISEMIPTLIGEYEYSAVAQLGLQYLKSVNLDDSAGRGILEYWPKKEG